MISPQAISGVSAGIENNVMTVYPSNACTDLGCLMGRCLNSIPLKINGIKVSNLLFALPLIPLALLMYAWLKLIGPRYVLTNRSVQIRSVIGDRQLGEAALPAVDHIDVDQRDGQEFYRAADLVLYDADETELLRLEGVPQAEIFRNTILEARDAHAQTEQALATIAARESA